MPCTGTFSVFLPALISSSAVCACAHRQPQHSHTASSFFITIPSRLDSCGIPHGFDMQRPCDADATILCRRPARYQPLLHHAKLTVRGVVCIVGKAVSPIFPSLNDCPEAPMPLTLKQANTICEKALEHARAKNYAKLTVVVLDESGNLKAVQR